MANEKTATKATSNGTFKSTSDLGVGRRIVEANLNSHKTTIDGKAKTLSKDELTKAGLQTHDEQTTITLSYGDKRFAVNDAKDLASLLAGVERFYNEAKAIRSAIATNGGQPLAVPKPRPDEAGNPIMTVVSDPCNGMTADSKTGEAVDPICAYVISMFRSGQALDWAQTLGKPLRDKAEAKYPKVAGSSSAKATDDNL